MKRRNEMVLIALLVMVSLCGCSIFTKIENAVEQQEDTETSESTVRYQDDYYAFVTDDLLDKIELEGTTDAQWSWFGELSAIASEEMQETIQEIINSDQQYEKGTMEQKIHDLYACIMAVEDKKDIELEPVEPYLTMIQDAETIDEYVEALATFSHEKGFASLLGRYEVEQDMMDSNLYVVYLMPPDILIGKEYLENESTQDICDTYFQYVRDALQVYGMNEKESEDAGNRIEEMLREICAHTMTLQEYSDPVAIYNEKTLEELQEIYSNIDVENMLEILEIADVETYILEDEEQAKYINTLLTEDNLETLKLYSTFVCINDIGEFACKELRDLQLQWANDLYGITESRTAEKQAIDDVENMLPWEFAKIYVEENFSEESKQEVEAMITDIIEEYEGILNRQEWMSEATKEKAIRKLDTMTIKIGYPDEWPDVCDFTQITPLEEGGSYLSNMVEMSAIGAKKNREKIGQPVDRTEWALTPQTVNAYYNNSNNEIVFPAAILQPPFYNSEADYATNLGGIGSVIAHEISHAFDDSGSQFDEYGNYIEWWTPEETAQYEALSQQIVDYYNGYEHLGTHVDGELTLGENIADLGALTCTSGIIGNQPEELRKLFAQMAYIWASESTVEYAMFLQNNDTHSPNRIRVNAVLSSCDAFYEAYDIAETDQMYVAPEKRVGIWK